MNSHFRALDTSYRRRKKSYVVEDHECDVFQSRLSSFTLSWTKRWFWGYRDSFQIPFHGWSLRVWRFWSTFLVVVPVSYRHTERSALITSNYLYIVFCRIRNHSHVSTIIFWATFECYVQRENDHPYQRICKILISRESSTNLAITILLVSVFISNLNLKMSETFLWETTSRSKESVFSEIRYQCDDFFDEV